MKPCLKNGGEREERGGGEGKGGKRERERGGGGGREGERGLMLEILVNSKLSKLYSKGKLNMTKFHI